MAGFLVEIFMYYDLGCIISPAQQEEVHTVCEYTLISDRTQIYALLAYGVFY
jgi:hypothetical protein